MNLTFLSEVNFEEKESFTSPQSRSAIISNLVDQNPTLFKEQLLGLSQEGREIIAVSFGIGPKNISVISGSHSDEPVGSETLLNILRSISQNEAAFSKLLSTFTFHVIPHVNLDGEVKNLKWMENWPNIESFLTGVYRELPGNDIEFGYPDLREENKIIANFLASIGKIDLHISLHGMAFAEGAMLLIKENWISRTELIRAQFIRLLKDEKFPIHDHNRHGEKGFTYIAPGFATTPNSIAMKEHFCLHNDFEMVSKFQMSSMEFVDTLKSKPLCLVTEIPLFLLKSKKHQTKSGFPTAYLEFLKIKPLIQHKLLGGKSIQKDIEDFQILPVAIQKAMKIQTAVIDFGLQMVS